MQTALFPETVKNWSHGSQQEAFDRGTFDKRSPATANVLCRAVRSRKEDVQAAIQADRSRLLIRCEAGNSNEQEVNSTCWCDGSDNTP